MEHGIKKTSLRRNFLFCFLILHQLLQSQAGSKDKNQFQGNLRRVVRSPQLFGGGKLTDLTSQIRPITLNDLNEFRQRMAGFANLTALLEQALAAERTARNALTNVINGIKDRVLGLHEAVNPDPENFWMESKECGGIVVSQTGKISYKPNDNYEDYERCVWTVRANHRSKIKVVFNSGNLEEPHDFVAVTELLDKAQGSNGADWKTKRIQPGQTNIFNGPIIFITFVSDGSIRKTGFKLDFEGLGTNINTKTIYQHFHLTDQKGHFDSANLSQSLQENNIKLGPGSSLKTTIVINPSYGNASRLRVSIPENPELRPEDCEKTELAIFNEFPTLRTGGKSNKCCGSVCNVSEYDTSSRVMLAILSSSDDVTDGSHFQINWETDTSDLKVQSVNTCGGLLKGDFGTISYKADAPYSDNERCVWAIYQDNMDSGSEIKIQLLKEGFEYQYDYLTVSYQNKDTFETQFLYKSGHPILIPAGIAFIQFYTDSATFGRTIGFELEWEIKYTRTNLGTANTHNIEYTSEESGTKELLCSPMIQVINPHFLDGSALVLEIDGGSSSGSSPIVVGSERGTFSKIESSDSGSYRSPDGSMILVSSGCSESGESVALKWRKGLLALGLNIPSTERDSDAAVFVKSVEDECGQLILGDSGRITYKLGKEYNLNERCTWVIQAKSVSTITVQLMADGFESCCDGILINKLDLDKGTIDPSGVLISRENRFQTFDSSALLVMFFSDHSVRGTGFTLEFQTKGDKVENPVALKHWHVAITKLPSLEEPFGPIFIQGSEKPLVTIDVFSLLRPDDGEVANSTKVSIKMDELNTRECGQESLALYHISAAVTTYEMLQQYPNEQLCPLGRVGVALASSLTSDNPVFHGVKGALVVISKFKGSSPTKSISVTLGG